MNNHSLVVALRLADSFLPVGTYTSSYAIEQYVNEGKIDSASELGDLIRGYLHSSSGPTDTVALANAHRAVENHDLKELLRIDELLHTATLPTEFRQSSQKAGNQLLKLMIETHASLFETQAGQTALSYIDKATKNETPGQYPVALGIITQLAGCSALDAALIHGYSFVTELLGAAQRLGAFGHTAIQRELTNLLPQIVSIATTYIDTPISALSSFAPMSEIMGMSHERASQRLFMS